MAPFDSTGTNRPAPAHPNRVIDETAVHQHRPADLLAVLHSPEVTEALEANALRCVTADFSTLARLSDPSKGKRHRWSSEQIDQQLAKLPADPLRLRPILERILPARLRIKSKRWSTIRSSVGRCLKLTGWTDGNDALRAPLTADWLRLCETFSGGKPRHQMIREGAFISVVTAFGRFCCRNGIASGAVTEETIEAYRRWRQERTLQLRIGPSINVLRFAWNEKARRSDSAFPIRQLAPPPDPRRYVDEERLEPAYRAAVDEYICKVRTPDPLDPIFYKKLANATVLQRHRVLLRAATILIESGHPPESITQLRCVVRPDAIRTVLMHLYHRLGNGKAWPASAVYTIGDLQAVARYVAASDPTALSDADLAQIDSFRKLVRVDARHLSKKNRDRLAALETPEMEGRFRRLPDDCFADADDLLAAGRHVEAAHLHATALALALAINKPLRRMNLAQLDFDCHFRRDDRGRIIALHIPAEEVVKSPVEVEAPLPPKLIKRTIRHWLIYRPLIVALPGSTALFANREGRPLHPNTLAESVMKLVRNRIGVEFNMHLVRHWAACKIFDEDPRNGAIAQALLGHMNPASTAKYGARRTRAAHRLYAELLERGMKSRRQRSIA